MTDDDNFDPQELAAKHQASMSALEYNKKFNRWAYFGSQANTKQREWCNLGGPSDPTAREFLLTASNQSGKSTIAAYAIACHLLGRYPAWWTGRKFLPENRPKLERPHSFSCWLMGPDATSVRSVMVAKLLGGLDKHTIGTGLVPADRILRFSKSSRPSDSLDEAIILRDDGSTASISCRFYTQDREQLQGSTLDLIHMDEDPGPRGIIIFGEIALRLARTGPGLLLSTQTPLHGRSFIVKHYEENKGNTCRTVRMGLADCDHMSEAEKEAIRVTIPEHERDAREHGLPSRGMGVVFSTPESDIRFRLELDPSKPGGISNHWANLWGIDFSHGGQSAQAHPAGFALAAINPHTNPKTIMIIDAFRSRGSVLEHIARIKSSMGGRAWNGVPVTYGHDGAQGVVGSSETIATLYKSQGLKMCYKHATFVTGGYDYDAGIALMRSLFASGHLKVADHLSEFFEEYRNLIYKDNKVVKVDNDIIDAVRMICMAHREARIPVPTPGGHGNSGRGVQFAKGTTRDIFQRSGYDD